MRHSERGGIYELIDVERTLGRIVVGYRGVALGWAVLLVLVAEAGDAGFSRTWVPWVEVVVILAWFAITVWLSGRRAGLITTWWFLVIDLLVAAGVLLASWLAGAPGVSLSGGYPLSALAVAVYAMGGRGALLTAGGLLGVALTRRFVLVDEASIAGLVSDLASWAFPAVVFSWATGVIRTSDARRRKSEGALADERAERARIEERAEVAALLHDSVLQTLALIQRSSADPDEVITLARRQERELRGWLYGTEPTVPGETLAGALRAVADGIEAETRVKVEVVSVGDVPMSESVVSLTRAAKEAMNNAAHHAGVDAIDVYAEAADDQVTVFVRDRGGGFDPSIVPADRAGVRESIVGRMRRAGGSAAIRSSSQRGTEVRLTLPRSEDE